jgi:hypothetical protein
MKSSLSIEILKLLNLNNDVKNFWKANLDAGRGLFQFDFFYSSLV